MNTQVSPEQDLQQELMLRSYPPQEAALMRLCLSYQALLRNAMWEIMRLESLVSAQE